MPEESADAAQPDAGSEPARELSPHDQAFAEAFHASFADPPERAESEPPAGAEDPSPVAEEAKPSVGGEMPTILLVQAGLTVFNAVIILIYIVFWMIDINMIASALRAGAAFAFLLALAPALLGAFLVRRYTKQKINPPGAIWAHVGVYVGVAMCTLTLLIPMIVTVRAIVGAQ
jgi:hypothetical protein